MSRHFIVFQMVKLSPIILSKVMSPKNPKVLTTCFVLSHRFIIGVSSFSELTHVIRRGVQVALCNFDGPNRLFIEVAKRECIIFEPVHEISNNVAF